MKKIFLLATLMIMAISTPLPAAAEINLFGGIPVLDAIKNNDAEAVDSLLIRDERNKEVEDNDYRRPLIYAASLGNTDIVELLIKRGAVLDHRDGLGNSAVFYAAGANYGEIVQVLLEAGANKDLENRQGVTPLMVAASRGHLEAVQVLLEKGADTSRRDYTGRTALMWAEWNRKANVVRVFKSAGIRE